MKLVREDREAGSEGRTRGNSPVGSRTGQGPMWQLAQFEDYVVNSIALATHPRPHILSKIDCSYLQHGSAALGGIGGKTLISHLGLWGTGYTPPLQRKRLDGWTWETLNQALNVGFSVILLSLS